MNRAPVAGDVITMARKEYVVIIGARTEDTRMYVFHCIKRDDLGKVNAKVHEFQLMGGPARCQVVALSDIGFIEQIKLKVKTEITYLEK